MRFLGFDLQYYINWLSRPKTPEAIAKKIVLLIEHETILFLIKPIIDKEIGLQKKSEKDRTIILHDMFVNGICFVVMMLQNIGEISKGERTAEFYTEVSVEVRSAYGNYQKQKNKVEDPVGYWSGLISSRLDDFRAVYEKNKNHLTPMPKGNPWHYVTGVVSLVILRNEKVREKEPLMTDLKKWIEKVEKITIDTCEDAVIR